MLYSEFIEHYSNYDDSSRCPTQQSEQINKKKNPTEAKNIPKNLGGLLKNHFLNQCSMLVKTNKAVKNYINTAQKKKNFTREDIKKLLEDKEAAQKAKKYFSSFEIIEDILLSEKIPDVATHLKYIKKFFIASHFPETLSTLKLPEQ